MSINDEPINSDPRSFDQISRRRALQVALGAAAAAIPTLESARAQDNSTQLHVFPSPGSQFASHQTQISFRGPVPESFGPMYATAAGSGEHSGTIVLHSDNNGFSWFPDFAFHPGETVTLHTRLDIIGGDEGNFSFTCAPSIEGRARGDRAKPAEDKNVRKFRTRPGLVPPRVETEIHNDALEPGYIFLSVIQGQGQNGALIIDNDGEPIWFQPAHIRTQELFDLKVVDYLGEPALIWWEGVRVLGQGSGHWVISNTTYEQIATIRIGNGFTGGDMHDVLLTARNTAIIGAYNTVHYDLSPIEGMADGLAIDCILQEIDLATGCVIFEWHCLDHVALEDTRREIDPERPDAAFDYFHYNSVAIDADDHLIIGARNTWAAYKVDRGSGEMIWRLGGKNSDFELGPEVEFSWQHDIRPQPDGTLSMFDNAAAPKTRDASRGLILSLDMDEMAATVETQYEHPDGILAGAQGNMQILPGGNIMIGWGSEPIVSEFAADGTLLLDVHFPEEKQSYRAYRFEWVGQPAQPPNVLAEANDDGGITVYASWNGATEVASWRVLAGDAEDALEPIGDETPRTGFETEIAVTSSAGFFAVEALDSTGNVLQTSRAVAPE